MINLKFLKEEYDEQSEIYLNESLGAFDGQYELSKELAEHIYDLSKLQVQTYVIYPMCNQMFKTVKVDINYNTTNEVVKAQISMLNFDEKKIGILLTINQNIINRNEYRYKSLLKNAIAHELMHGNVFFQRHKNQVEIFDAPIYYDSLVKILGQEENNKVLYNFVDGLYITYYQEMNALVSQTNVQIYNQLGYGKDVSNEMIKNALKKTEPYYRYTTLLNKTLPFIEKMSDDDIINMIVKPLNEEGIECDVIWVKKQCQRMKHESEIALEHIFRNAMLKGKNIYENIRLNFYDKI